MDFTTFFNKLTHVLDSEDYPSFTKMREELRGLLKDSVGATNDTPKNTIVEETMSEDPKKLPTKLIMFSSWVESIDGVKMLLESGVSVNDYDDVSWTPLMYASKYSSPEVVKFLIDAGADVNKGGTDKMTPLILASLYSSAETVKLLIDAGADVNALSYQGYTPLLYASGYPRNTPNAEIAKLLVAAGANVNVRTPCMYNSTPLMCMARNGTPDVVKALIDAGADIDAIEATTGRTALFYAAEHSNKTGNPGNLKVLLDAGANVRIKNAKGKNVVQVCLNEVKTSTIATIEMLIDALC